MNVENVLLIEDDLLFAKVFEKRLNGIGAFNIHHCSSVEEGLEFIEKIKPELMFLDHQLDGMNGVDSIHLFKEVLPGVEICIVSEQRSAQVVEKALDLDVKYFRKNALLLEKTEEFLKEVRDKPSKLGSFWSSFLKLYSNSIPEHL